jgi:sialic acid synthase SpsE
MLSCFEISTIAWAEEMRLPCMKVASRAAKNFPWNEWSGRFLVSTGMWRPNIKQIAKMPDSVTFMQCTAEYPSEVRWQGAVPGYSSHSAGPFRAIEAICSGAAFIECHYQDLMHDPGPDEPVSLTPSQLTTICEARDYYYEQRVK